MQVRPQIGGRPLLSVSHRPGARAIASVDAPRIGVYCPATNFATTALVMTPWVTLVHASAACGTAG